MAGIFDWLFPTQQGEAPTAVSGDAGQAQANTSPWGSGFMGQVGNALDQNRQTMIGFGLGLMSGDSKGDAYRNAMLGAQRGVVLDASSRKEKQADEEKKKRQAVYQQLASKYGLPPEIAADPDLAQQALAQKLTPKDPGFEEKLYNSLPDSLKEQYKQRFATGGQKDDTILQRYKYGTAMGLQGDELRRYALTGGMTELTKPLPAEQGARLGMSENFLAESPVARKAIEAGDATGPVDALKGWAGMGEQGAIARHIESGKDALIRNLTGQGMSVAEADKYVARYNISPTDSKQTALDKYDRLVAELQAIRAKTYEGRGTPPPITPKTSVGQYLGGDQQQGSQGTGVSKGGGRTKSGVQWSF